MSGKWANRDRAAVRREESAKDSWLRAAREGVLGKELWLYVHILKLVFTL